MKLKKISHMDIKPLNLLVNIINDNYYYIMLSDFGESKFN